MRSLTVWSNGPGETQALGCILSQWLSGGDVISLVGDLGAGKTIFVKGIAAGLGINDSVVTSPTFSLIHEYTGRVPLYHFDAYRLERQEEWEDLGYEEYFRGSGISVVEWGNLVADYFPKEYLQVELKRESVPDDRRQITFTPVGDRYRQLLRQLEKEVEHADFGDRYIHGHRKCCPR
ncbi:MAG: tRNA (adenosine(37)-N6)-threonylcarbamoyltransferase complex ATPase subunit type 1 TsaE [Firmicutes bacterium]|nr:tRNA (adenosine(37)-N6)-threonylcarbamoyltransferase complex ATPase subunit type 1 TsaE [Bacillota bacterium]